jgi:hypothetical protein
MGVARKPAAEQTQSAEELTSEALDVAPDPIPLALAPLIAPYKRRGRVRLRIERLPRHARLSQGQNNGDHSWSLMLDELEDLKYLPPKGSTEASVLSIRILSVEGGDATTLAVLDYDLPAPTRSVPAGDSSSAQARKSSDDAELRRLRSELAKAQSALSARDAELETARRDAEDARSEVSRQAIDRELAAARSEWEAELEQRVASLASDKTSDLQKSRESWRRETETALARAEKEWRTAEAERLAASEASWKEKLSRTLAQSRTEAEALRSDSAELTGLRDKVATLQSALTRAEGELLKTRADGVAAEDRARKSVAQSRAEAEALRSDSTELTALRDKVATLQSALTRAEGELVKMRADGAAAEDRARKSVAQSRAEADTLRGDSAELGRLRQKIEALQSSLAKREGEFARLREEAAEAEERAKKNLSLARAEAETLRGDSGELGRLRERLERLQASLVTRDKELAQARADVVEAENRSRKEIEIALAKAEKGRKAQEEGLLQAAEARWKEQAALSETEMRDRARDRDAEVRRLKSDLERVQKALADREGAVKDARGTTEVARDEGRRALEAALARAESEKNAIESRWQEQFAQAVGAVTAQLGRSEKALEEARTEIASLRGGDSEIERLRHECTDLKGSLAEQENELRRQRAVLEESRERAKREKEEAIARAESLWQANEAARLIAAEQRWKEQSRDAMEQAAAHSQRAEAALTKLHSQEEAQRSRNLDYQRSRDECAALRDALAQREKELAEARWTLIQTRERKFGDVEPTAAQREEPIWSAETLQKLNRPIGVPKHRLFDPDSALAESAPEIEEKPARHIGRDLFIVMILAVLVVGGAIRFAPDSWWAAIMPAATQDPLEPPKPHAAVPKTQPAEPPAPPETTVIRSANVRSGPSKTADAVGTLAKGTRVVVVEHHGNWVHVQGTAQDGKHKVLDGWVFNTFLGDTTGTASKDPSPPKSP